MTSISFSKMQMEISVLVGNSVLISVNGISVLISVLLMLKGEQNDNNYVFCFSDDKISNASNFQRTLKLFKIRTYCRRQLSFDQHCIKFVRELSQAVNLIFRNFKLHHVELLV